MSDDVGGPDAIEGPVAWLERRLLRWKLRVGRDWPGDGAAPRSGKEET